MKEDDQVGLPNELYAIDQHPPRFAGRSPKVIGAFQVSTARELPL